MDTETIWKTSLEQVRPDIPEYMFASMLAPLQILSVDNGTCTVGAPNSFTKDIVSSRYATRLSEAVSEVLGRDTSIVVTVVDAAGASAIDYSSPDSHEQAPSEGPGLIDPGKSSAQKRYTFENFVVGDSNKFAYHAALMVGEFPGQKFNPLFIYGGTGLGKTHLLLAIKDYAEKTPNTKVKYVQTSSFIDEFIATLTQKRDKASFDQKYINNKIVLFDDVQALSSTDATQDKFFDLFNLLYASNSHIVLSSDRPPSEIPRLSDRIRSRFEGGLRVDIMPPDLETRLAILKTKAEADGVEVPDDALRFIASKVKDNIRSLEGLLNRVVASAVLYQTRIDLEMVQDVLKDQVADSALSRVPPIELIQNLASEYYKILNADLVGKCRSRPLVHARQVAMYLCREMTDATLLSIGSQFGGRDHTTVLHSCRKVESLIKTKRETFEEVTELTNMINRSL